jgi:tetrahydromethanopterin S-methyltransferase subunit D
MLKKPQKPSKKISYEQIGRMVENIYLSGYIDKNQMYKMTFVKGLLAGLGGVIGATVIVALVLWLLSLFNYTPLQPLIEPIIDVLESAVNSDK